MEVTGNRVIAETVLDLLLWMVNGIPLARQEMFVRVCIMNPIMYELPSTDYVCNYHYPYFLFNKITFFKRWHPVVCLTIGV